MNVNYSDIQQCIHHLNVVLQNLESRQKNPSAVPFEKSQEIIAITEAVKTAQVILIGIVGHGKSAFSSSKVSPK